MHNVSSTRVAEFDFLTENLDSGCLIYHIVSEMLYLNVTSVKTDFINTFFPLSHTFYFKTRPSPLSKNQGKCIWCALSAALPQKRVR